jgi:transcriptional regulator with XRE-family HTH domain
MAHLQRTAKAGRPAKIPRSPFGLRLAAAIDEKFPTRHQFLHACGNLHSSTLNKYENGTNQPRIDQVEEWASVLGVSPGWLAFGVEAPADAPAEQSEDVERAAVIARLDADGVKRLRKVRAICGPMTTTALVAVAESIARLSSDS